MPPLNPCHTIRIRAGIPSHWGGNTGRGAGALLLFRNGLDTSASNTLNAGRRTKPPRNHTSASLTRALQGSRDLRRKSPARRQPVIQQGALKQSHFVIDVTGTEDRRFLLTKITFFHPPDTEATVTHFSEHGQSNQGAIKVFPTPLKNCWHLGELPFQPQRAP